jgi:hypothetical protein
MLKSIMTTSVAATALLTLSLVTTPVFASTSFDGSWSVRIVTQRGSCDSGASLPIRVADGNVASDLSVVKVSGQVTANGTLRVSVGNGIKRANGVGRLLEQSGSGTWSGGPCSGIWTAQKN